MPWTSTRPISTHALLAEGDDFDRPLAFGVHSISTHALLAEGDLRLHRGNGYQRGDFNPRPPCGGRHAGAMTDVGGTIISTHALLAEGDEIKPEDEATVLISTHALLAEGDRQRPRQVQRRADFNPRPPCGGRRQSSADGGRLGDISTHALLAEGDTRCRRDSLLQSYFNPRPPCGGRLGPVGPVGPGTVISTHALLAEGDAGMFDEPREVVISTHALLAEGDFRSINVCLDHGISTHALLAEGDSRRLRRRSPAKPFQPTPSLRRATTTQQYQTPLTNHFNPRPPCGGRPGDKALLDTLKEFQPTPSLRRATRVLHITPLRW